MKSARSWYMFMMLGGIGLQVMAFIVYGWRVWLVCLLVHIFGVLQGGFDMDALVEERDNGGEKS